MVTIVAELIQHQRILREHAEKPFEPVTCLVEDVGNSVRAGETIAPMAIPEAARRFAVRHHHHVGCVRRGRHVLEIVGGVGPSPAHGDELTGAAGVVDEERVFLVDGVTEERIVSGPLLAHVEQQRIPDAVVGRSGDAHRRRMHPRRDHSVAPFVPHRREIQAMRRCARAEWAGRDRRERAENATAVVRLDREVTNPHRV